MATKKEIEDRKAYLNKKFGTAQPKTNKATRANSKTGGDVIKYTPSAAELKRRYKTGKPVKKPKIHQSNRTSGLDGVGAIKGLPANVAELVRRLKANLGGTTRRSSGTSASAKAKGKTFDSSITTNNPKLLKEIKDDKKKLAMINKINKELSKKKGEKGTGRSSDQLKKTRADVKAVVAKRLSGDATGVYGSGKAKAAKTAKTRSEELNEKFGRKGPKTAKPVSTGTRKRPSMDDPVPGSRLSNRKKAMIDEQKRLRDRKLTGADGSNYKSGGAVKKCKRDGIAQRGRTKGRMV